jgi:hypothetical protein
MHLTGLLVLETILGPVEELELAPEGLRNLNG